MTNSERGYGEGTGSSIAGSRVSCAGIVPAVSVLIDCDPGQPSRLTTVSRTFGPIIRGRRRETAPGRYCSRF